jgi:DNA processing protein
MRKEAYYYWLHRVPGLGNETIGKLLKWADPEQIYREGTGSLPLPLSVKQKLNLEEMRQNKALEEDWKKLEERGITLLYRGGKDYPADLEQIPRPPQILYCKGSIQCFHPPAVAVVGARECSGYGSLAARELGRALAQKGIVVVSGMARGIDGLCQWAALDNAGSSIGVLGGGVEICYPPENRHLYSRLIQQGCLISEHPPWTEPKPGLFPLRNRIISGLADVVVVVEARERSGTLITVDMALEQGKEVYAMPGRITDALSLGCNRLIRQGAGILLSPWEFVEEIEPLLTSRSRQAAPVITPSPEPAEQKCSSIANLREGTLPGAAELTTEEKEIYRLLEITPKSLESLWEEARTTNPGLTLPDIMNILSHLCSRHLAGNQNRYFYKV